VFGGVNCPYLTIRNFRAQSGGRLRTGGRRGTWGPTRTGAVNRWNRRACRSDARHAELWPHQWAGRLVAPCAMRPQDGAPIGAVGRLQSWCGRLDVAEGEHQDKGGKDVAALACNRNKQEKDPAPRRVW